MDEASSPPEAKDSTAEHSPLPWTTGKFGKESSIYGADGKIIGGDNWPSNLPLVLRAVNNHERLLAALEDCETTFRRFFERDFKMSEWRAVFKTSWARACVAIADAKGEPT